MYRVEDKYNCSELDMAVIQSRIAALLKRDGNQTARDGYKVTTVYFDDLMDTHLSDTSGGFAERRKYRIRIYNNSFDVIKLEVKSKLYNRVFKKSELITYEEMKALLAGRHIRGGYCSLEDPVTLFNLGILERGLRPKIIVEYDRQAYVYESGNVRITFDRNIRSCRETERFGDQKAEFVLLKENAQVLEVKYDEFFPSFIAQLLETGNLIQSSCSKYKLCREDNMR